MAIRIFLFGLILLGCTQRSLLAGTLGTPNIIFVLFDDIGYGQPTSYRTESPFRTPNINRLAQEGMLFTDAHAAAANCTPTRYGVLTGRYPCRIGQFGVLKTYSPPIIPADRPTVASFLQQQGYHTACIGKWHLGMNWIDGKPGTEKKLPIGAKLTDGPNSRGFDYFYGFTHARNIGSIIEQDTVVANVDAVENQPLMIKQAVKYITNRGEKEKPFFLYFPMCPPHSPIVPTDDMKGKGGYLAKSLVMEIGSTKEITCLARYLTHSNKLGKQRIRSLLPQETMVLRNARTLHCGTRRAAFTRVDIVSLSSRDGPEE